MNIRALTYGEQSVVQDAVEKLAKTADSSYPLKEQLERMKHLVAGGYVFCVADPYKPQENG